MFSHNQPEADLEDDRYFDMTQSLKPKYECKCDHPGNVTIRPNDPYQVPSAFPSVSTTVSTPLTQQNLREAEVEQRLNQVMFKVSH